VLLHDSYFSTGSPQPHELRSPLPGHPAELWPVFGSPPDIITIERDGAQIGLWAKNYATRFAWVGPLFVPLIPIPGREIFETSPLELWVGIVSDRAVEIQRDGFQLWIAGDAGKGTRMAPHEIQERVARKGLSSWDVVFLLPEGEPIESFELVITGLRTAAGPLDPAFFYFSLVEGWRAGSLP
jgi:hypothetical protein